MSRYIGRHRRTEAQDDGDTMTLVPPSQEHETLSIMEPEETVTLVPSASTLVLSDVEGQTRVLDPIDAAAAEAARRDRDQRGRFVAAKGPDEQDDKDDSDPQPGDPIRQVPGEKDKDPRVN